jgi:hypothetical protein
MTATKAGAGTKGPADQLRERIAEADAEWRAMEYFTVENVLTAVLCLAAGFATMWLGFTWGLWAGLLGGAVLFVVAYGIPGAWKASRG